MTIEDENDSISADAQIHTQRTYDQARTIVHIEHEDGHSRQGFFVQRWSDDFTLGLVRTDSGPDMDPLVANSTMTVPKTALRELADVFPSDTDAANNDPANPVFHAVEADDQIWTFTAGAPGGDVTISADRASESWGSPATVTIPGGDFAEHLEWATNPNPLSS